MSAFSRAAAALGKACGMQPVSTITAPGFCRRALCRVCRTLWSLVAVTVQELISTTSLGSLPPQAENPARTSWSSMAWDSY